MNTLLRTILAALLAIAAMPGAFARLTAEKAFADAPMSVFPLLDRDARLDMIDYYNSSMANPTTNAMGGKSRITLMNPTQLHVSVSGASSYELNLLPGAAGDTIIALVTTVATPAPDSRIALFSSDWSRNMTAETFAKPTLDDWLTPEGASRKGEVEGMVPFLLISYAYDPATKTLSMSNNTKRFLSADVYSIVEPSLRKSLAYRWDGTKFVKQL